MTQNSFGELDWDDVYRDGEALPPWSIGEPQPEIAALIAQGLVAGSVLDAGCGHAEVGLTLAALGHDVVGLDLSAGAIASANLAAAERGLADKAIFAAADISSFGGYDGRFDTIIDSALFHSLPRGLWEGYQQSISRAAAPGATYYVLTFAPEMFSGLPDSTTRPHAPSVEELRETVSPYWEIDDISPAFIHARCPGGDTAAGAGTGWELPPLDRDGKGFVKLPAHLLSAHLR